MSRKGLPLVPDAGMDAGRVGCLWIPVYLRCPRQKAAVRNSPLASLREMMMICSVMPPRDKSPREARQCLAAASIDSQSCQRFKRRGGIEGVLVGASGSKRRGAFSGQDVSPLRVLQAGKDVVPGCGQRGVRALAVLLLHLRLFGPLSVPARRGC